MNLPATLMIIVSASLAFGCKARKFNESSGPSKSASADSSRDASFDELLALYRQHKNSMEATHAVHSCKPRIICYQGTRDSGGTVAGSVEDWKKKYKLDHIKSKNGYAVVESTKDFFGTQIVTEVRLDEEALKFLKTGEVEVARRASPAILSKIYANRENAAENLNSCLDAFNADRGMLAGEETSEFLSAQRSKLYNRQVVRTGAWAICTSPSATKDGFDAVRRDRGSKNGYHAGSPIRTEVNGGVTYEFSEGSVPSNAEHNVISKVDSARFVGLNFCYKEGFPSNISFRNLPKCIDLKNDKLERLEMPGESNSGGKDNREPERLPDVTRPGGLSNEEPQFLPGGSQPSRDEEPQPL
ncbi:MAG: hypothetical protein IOD12_11990 [Silvanigrellales bacterium]|nr:hypothetical protein [Silvanigrellales bacterium]